MQLIDAAIPFTGKMNYKFLFHHQDAACFIYFILLEKDLIDDNCVLRYSVEVEID